MHIEPLTPQKQAAALAYLRAAPYRNALLLSNLTQLRASYDVLIAERGGAILGIASTYHDLPVPNLVFAAATGEIAGTLLHALVDRNPQLRAAPAYALLPAERRDQLARYAQVLESEIEYQMAIEPEILVVDQRWPVRRLTAADLPEMDALASGRWPDGLAFQRARSWPGLWLLRRRPAGGDGRHALRDRRGDRDRPYRDSPQLPAARLCLGLRGGARAGGPWPLRRASS